MLHHANRLEDSGSCFRKGRTRSPGSDACPAGSSFAAHIHTGPGEYFLTHGRMDVRGGRDAGGDTAVAPGYGLESSGARHDRTFFPVDSVFYMTFLGPLAFIQPDGTVIANIGWAEAQGAWTAFLSAQS